MSMTVRELEQKLVDNNRQHGTQFTLGRTYHAFDLWNGDRRIESGSLKDVWQAFVRERFKESAGNVEENPPRGIFLTLEKLTKTLGITDPEEFQQNFDYSEPEGEDADEYADEMWKKYVSAVESVAESSFDEVGLSVNAVYKTDRGTRYVSGYRITPNKSWRDSANEIREIINGEGMFEFPTLREFLDSGPYTPREAVEQHLHWIRKRSEVYGEASPQRRFERLMDR